MNKAGTSEVRLRLSNKENIFPNSFKKGATRVRKLEEENERLKLELKEAHDKIAHLQRHLLVALANR